MNLSLRKSFLIFCIAVGALVFPASAQLLDSARLPQQKFFESLEEALKEPDLVYRLNLGKQRLTAIPPEIFQFKNLQELDLSKNKITVIPPEISNLPLLQILDLSDNQIDYIPSHIGKRFHL